jgi:hypothetical protein
VSESLVTQFKIAGYETPGIGKLWHGGLGWKQQWSSIGQEKSGKARPAEDRSIGGIRFGPSDARDEDMTDYSIASYGIEQVGKAHAQPFSYRSVFISRTCLGLSRADTTTCIH